MTTATVAPTRFVLAGDYMLDGQIQNTLPRKLAIKIRDGGAYDEDGEHFPDARPLGFDESGELIIAARQGFLPNDGEVARVEQALGRQIFKRV